MLKVGTKVHWKWLGRMIAGKVVEVHNVKLVRTIKGKRITRNGSKENPAYVVVSDAGNLALKLGTELTIQEAENQSSKRKLPTMF